MLPIWNWLPEKSDFATKSTLWEYWWTKSHHNRKKEGNKSCLAIRGEPTNQGNPEPKTTNPVKPNFDAIRSAQREIQIPKYYRQESPRNPRAILEGYLARAQRRRHSPLACRSCPSPYLPSPPPPCGSVDGVLLLVPGVTQAFILGRLLHAIRFFLRLGDDTRRLELRVEELWGVWVWRVGESVRAQAR